MGIVWAIWDLLEGRSGAGGSDGWVLTDAASLCGGAGQAARVGTVGGSEGARRRETRVSLMSERTVLVSEEAGPGEP